MGEMESEPHYEEGGEMPIPHDPNPTEEQLAIWAIVDELYRRLKY